MQVSPMDTECLLSFPEIFDITLDLHIHLALLSQVPQHHHALLERILANLKIRGLLNHYSNIMLSKLRIEILARKSSGS